MGRNWGGYGKLERAPTEQGMSSRVMQYPVCGALRWCQVLLRCMLFLDPLLGIVSEW